MDSFLGRVVVNGLALWLAAWAIDGVHLADGNGDWPGRLLTVALVALIFGVVNALLKPLALFLAFPAIALTLGLFIFIVNAFMLQLTEWIAKPLGIAFSIDDFFWDAVLAALIITLVSWAVDMLTRDERQRRQRR